MNTLEKISLDELIDLLMSANDTGNRLMSDENIHFILNEKIEAIQDKEEKEFYYHVISGLNIKIASIQANNESDVKDCVITELIDELDDVDELVKRKLEIDKIFNQLTYDALFDNNYYSKLNFICEDNNISNLSKEVSKSELHQEYIDEVISHINGSKCRFNDLFNIKLETIACFEPIFYESKYLQGSFNKHFHIKSHKGIYNEQLYKNILLNNECINLINDHLKLTYIDTNCASYLKVRRNNNVHNSNKNNIKKLVRFLKRNKKTINNFYLPNIIWFKLDDYTSEISSYNINRAKDGIVTKITWFKLLENHIDDNVIYFKMNEDGTINSDEVAVFNIKNSSSISIELEDSIHFNTLHYFVTEPTAQSSLNYPNVIGYSEASNLTPSLCM